MKAMLTAALVALLCSACDPDSAWLVEETLTLPTRELQPSMSSLRTAVLVRANDTTIMDRTDAPPLSSTFAATVTLVHRGDAAGIVTLRVVVEDDVGNARTERVSLAGSGESGMPLLRDVELFMPLLGSGACVGGADCERNFELSVERVDGSANATIGVRWDVNASISDFGSDVRDVPEHLAIGLEEL